MHQQLPSNDHAASEAEVAKIVRFNTLSMCLQSHKLTSKLTRVNKVQKFN